MSSISVSLLKGDSTIRYGKKSDKPWVWSIYTFERPGTIMINVGVGRWKKKIST